MAFVHDSSAECTKSELDLFQVEPTQVSVEEGTDHDYHPLSSLTDASDIEFLVNGSSDYVDLNNSFLYIKAKITKADGSNLDADEATAPVNNFLHSLFSQVDVQLEGTTITSSNATYAYRAYIETLLSFNKSSKSTQLSTAMYYKDTAGRMDSITVVDATSNSGFMKRRELAAESRSFEVMGRLHGDIFFQERYIISGVNIKLKLSRSKDAFCIMSNHAGRTVKILCAQFRVRKLKVSPSVALAHEKTLQVASAKYPLRRVLTKTSTLSAGISDSSQDRFFNGQLPVRVIIGLVSNQAFNGSRAHNPFNFQHFNLAEIQLFLDGRAAVAPIKMNYADANYMQAYWSLFTGTQKANKDESNDIMLGEYPNGYCLYAFDLTPDLCEGGHFNLLKQGSVRLALRFSEPLAAAVTVIAYAEFENILEINSQRSVVFDYAS
jgi:hypothetical protein